MKKFDDLPIRAFAEGDTHRGFVGFAGDVDVFGFDGDLGTCGAGAFNGRVAIAGTQGKVDDRALGFGFVRAIGKNLEVVPIARIEHDRTPFALAPGDFFAKPEGFGVKCD